MHNKHKINIENAVYNAHQEGMESPDHGSPSSFKGSNKLMSCDHFCRVSAERHLLLDVERAQCPGLNVNNDEASNRQSTGTVSGSMHFYGRMSKRAAC
jgi:hypothetical protein